MGIARLMSRALYAGELFRRDSTSSLIVNVRCFSIPRGSQKDDLYFEFAEPRKYIAPGQIAVVLDGDRVLGCGTIAETFDAYDTVYPIHASDIDVRLSFKPRGSLRSGSARPE